MYHLHTKRTGKTSQRKREHEFFETQKPHVHWFIAQYLPLRNENLIKSTSWTLLVTLEWIYSSSAFIKSPRKNRIVCQPSAFV